MFGIQPELLQQLTAALGQTQFLRSLGPTILAAGMLKEQAAIVSKDENCLRVRLITDIAHDLALGDSGKGSFPHVWVTR